MHRPIGVPKRRRALALELLAYLLLAYLALPPIAATG